MIKRIVIAATTPRLYHTPQCYTVTSCALTSRATSCSGRRAGARGHATGARPARSAPAVQPARHSSAAGRTGHTLASR